MDWGITRNSLSHLRTGSGINIIWRGSPEKKIWTYRWFASHKLLTDPGKFEGIDSNSEYWNHSSLTLPDNIAVLRTLLPERKRQSISIISHRTDPTHAPKSLTAEARLTIKFAWHFNAVCLSSWDAYVSKAALTASHMNPSNVSEFSPAGLLKLVRWNKMWNLSKKMDNSTLSSFNIQSVDVMMKSAAKCEVFSLYRWYSLSADLK